MAEKKPTLQDQVNGVITLLGQADEKEAFPSIQGYRGLKTANDKGLLLKAAQENPEILKDLTTLGNETRANLEKGEKIVIYDKRTIAQSDSSLAAFCKKYPNLVPTIYGVFKPAKAGKVGVQKVVLWKTIGKYAAAAAAAAGITYALMTKGFPAGKLEVIAREDCRVIESIPHDTKEPVLFTYSVDRNKVYVDLRKNCRDANKAHREIATDFLTDIGKAKRTWDRYDENCGCLPDYRDILDKWKIEFGEVKPKKPEPKPVVKKKKPEPKPVVKKKKEEPIPQPPKMIDCYRCDEIIWQVKKNQFPEKEGCPDGWSAAEPPCEKPAPQLEPEKKKPASPFSDDVELKGL